MENVVLNGCSVHASFFPFLWASLYTCYLSRTSLSDLDVSRGQGSVGSQKRKKIASHYITCASSSCGWGGHMRCVRVRSPWGEMAK